MNSDIVIRVGILFTNELRASEVKPSEEGPVLFEDPELLLKIKINALKDELWAYIREMDRETFNKTVSVSIFDDPI